MAQSTLYTSTLCQTWYYGTSLTAYGCGTVSLTINVIPLSLTPFTPIASSSALASLSLTSSSTSSLGVQTTPSTSQSAAPAIPSATAFSPSSSSNEPASLSTGAQAGIGVGASVAAILLIAVLFIIFRKKHKAILRQAEGEIPEPSNHQKSILSKLSSANHEHPVELTALATSPHHGRSELSNSQEVAHELQAS
jgi:cbb3-type cytochrome oxidase subunit 3